MENGLKKDNYIIIDFEVILNFYLIIYLFYIVRYSLVGVLGNYIEILSWLFIDII